MTWDYFWSDTLRPGRLYKTRNEKNQGRDPTKTHAPTQSWGAVTQTKKREELKDAIEPNPLHHNNLYATTKAERSNLQERSNNQENDLMRPHKNKRRGNEPLITLTRDL